MNKPLALVALGVLLGVLGFATPRTTSAAQGTPDPCAGCNPVCWGATPTRLLRRPPKPPYFESKTLHVWVGPDDDGCYTLEQWIRGFAVYQYPYCSNGKPAGVIHVMELWYIKKLQTTFKYCPGEGAELPPDAPGSVNPPTTPGGAPTPYTPASAGGVCFGHSLLCPPEDGERTGSSPPDGEPDPNSAPGESGWEGANSDDVKINSNDARKILDSSSWSPSGGPIPYPDEGDDPPTVPECCVLVLESDNATEGVKNHPRHVARSNGDGTYDSKDDDKAPDPDATFEEAFGPTKELLKKRGDTNIHLRIYCKQGEDCCPEEQGGEEEQQDTSSEETGGGN